MPAEGYHHGDLAGAALAEAARLVEAEGPDALSLRRVAAAAGVTHRALYRHYADKDALLLAVAQDGYAALAAATAAQDAEGFARAYVRFALSRPGLYEAMMGRLARDCDTDAIIAGARAAFGDDEAVKRAWATMHGALALHRNGALAARDDAELTGFILSLVRP